MQVNDFQQIKGMSDSEYVKITAGDLKALLRDLETAKKEAEYNKSKYEECCDVNEELLKTNSERFYEIRSLNKTIKGLEEDNVKLRHKVRDHDNTMYQLTALQSISKSRLAREAQDKYKECLTIEYN